MNTNNLNHKRVMHMAHILYRRDCDLSPISDAKPEWKRSCNEAWDIQDVRTALQKGLVKLTYGKKNGDKVCRIGTLNPDYIPAPRCPKVRAALLSLRTTKSSITTTSQKADGAVLRLSGLL